MDKVKEVFYSINNQDYELYNKPIYLSSTSGNLMVNTYAIDNVNNRSSKGKASSQNTRLPYIDLTGPVLNFDFQGAIFKIKDLIYISANTKIILKAKGASKRLAKPALLVCS